MKTWLARLGAALFPVQRHEWPKALILLSMAVLLGIGFSISRAASEALFLTRFGVEYLPYLLLANPVLVLVSSTVYGVFADRISDTRLMIYTSLAPVPLIILMYVLMHQGWSWVYFALYTFVLSYASILTTSWTVYVSGHYDVQEGKRLLPFIASGTLIGTVMGGLGIAWCVPLIGAANVLWVWLGTLLVGVGLVRAIAKTFTAIDTKTRKPKRGAARQTLRQSLAEGLAYSRASALFMTTAIASIATMMALQLMDYEYSKTIRATFPDSAALTAFLGVFDGLTTLLALLLQWFVVPWCLRRFGVQGTNLLFPYVLLMAFGGLAMVPWLPMTALPAAAFARFTRASLMPTLRGTTRTLMLNAVPRKTGALVRSFNTAIVLPLGQGVGAVLLLLLKGVGWPLMFPVLGLLITLYFLYYSYKQNTAYGQALIDLLREDKIHLLDLEADDFRQLGASAVAAISARLRSDNDDVSMAAIDLLRMIGTPTAYSSIQQQLPGLTPRARAAALQALTQMSQDAAAALRPYLHDPEPQVRTAALAGLQHLRDSGVQQQASAFLNDPDVQVRATALAIILTQQVSPAYARAEQLYHAMLEAADQTTLQAALTIMPQLPGTSWQGRLYRVLDHDDIAVRHQALRVLLQLARAGRVSSLDSALLRAVETDDVETRTLALEVLTAIGTDEALEHMLILLDDEQPLVRETLIKSLKPYGKRAIAPLFERLWAPQTSFIAKESTLLALASLHGVQPDQLLEFWETALQEVYRYKLMLTCLAECGALEADAFLQAALHNAYTQMLSLLTQLLAVWSSPEVARLIENGLHDTDRHKRASALEALENIGERRFIRLFLPLLEGDASSQGAWREVAERHWGLTVADVPAMLQTCILSTNAWIVIGAMLSAQARLELRDDAAWQARLQDMTMQAGSADVRDTARQMLGLERTSWHLSLSLTDTMLFLKRVPMYSNMTLEQLRTIAAHLTERDVQPEEVIFQEGDLSLELYLIVAGQVAIIRQRPDHTPHVLVTLGAGDFFGDMAIFENRPRSAGAVAVEHGVLLTFSPEHFRQVIMQDPAISFEIFRALSARIRRFNTEILEMAQRG